MQSNRPAFLGESWYLPEQGYGYASRPTFDLLDKIALRSNDPWPALAPQLLLDISHGSSALVLARR